MADAPTPIDGSKGTLVVRRVVVWRRMEPGDVRTPGTELSAESPHLEAKVVDVGVAEELRADMARLWKVKDEVMGAAYGWSARYEPAGALFATGGAASVAVLLDLLPLIVFPVSATLTVLGVALGAYTRARKLKSDREVDKRWHARPERKELERIEKTLKPRWERFGVKLRDAEGFRTDVRVGDIHEADRLVSLDLDKIAHPDTWAPDEKEGEVRYGWVYSDGRYVEQVAELEESDVPVNDAGEKDEEE